KSVYLPWGVLFLHRESAIQPQVEYFRMGRAFADFRIVIEKILKAPRVVAISQEEGYHAAVDLGDDADVFGIGDVHLRDVLGQVPHFFLYLEESAHAGVAIGLGFLFAHAGEHGEGEVRLGRWFEENALGIDEQRAGAEGDEGHGLALADGDHQAVRPDTGDGGVGHPIDGQEAAAALAERNGKDAAVEIGSEDALHFGARGVGQTQNGERILVIAREPELLVGRNVDAGSV